MLCAVDVLDINVWLSLLEDKNVIKLIKLVNQGDTSRIFCNKSSLKHHETEVFCIHNEGKSIVPKPFVTTSKNKMYKYK